MKTNIPNGALCALRHLAWMAVLGAAHQAYALVISNPDHKLDADEVRLDTQAPGPLAVTSVVVTRGRPSPPGTWVEDANLGSVILYVRTPSDNRTPGAKMGYRILAVSGCLPGGLSLPRQDVRALLSNDQRPYLVLYFTDPTPHAAIQFKLSVAAVDLAGKAGPETLVEVRDPPPVVGCPAGTRKCPSDGCVAISQPCRTPCPSNADCCEYTADCRCRIPRPPHGQCP